MRNFIAVDEDNVVTSTYRTSDVNFKPEYYKIEIKDKKEKQTIQEGMEDGLLWENNKVVKKSVLKFEADKYLIVADGIDTAIVSLTGFPPGVDQVQVLVGKDENTLGVGETLQVSTTKQGAVVVKLNEKKLSAKSIKIHAEKPIGGE